MPPRKRDLNPIFLPGGDVGCILLHGLAGSPGQMRRLAERLANCGYTVVAPAWPWSEDGIKSWDAVRSLTEGTKPWVSGSPASAGSLAEAWMEAAAAETARLSSTWRKLFLVGLSLGAAVSLAVVGRLEPETSHPGGSCPVSGIISLGCPVDIADAAWRRQLREYLRGALPGLYREEPGGERPIDPILEVVDRVIRETGDRAPSVECPTLVVHSRVDKVVPPRHAEELGRLLGSRDCRLLWLERSPHVCTLGMERERLFAEVDGWIREISGSTKSALNQQ